MRTIYSKLWLPKEVKNNGKKLLMKSTSILDFPRDKENNAESDGLISCHLRSAANLGPRMKTSLFSRLIRI
jgi:hypothetical protein